MIALNLLALAIGVGLLITLFVTEAFGIAAGGLVVPGYMALRLMQPVNFSLTVLVALATFALIRVMSSFTVIYGRRMTALMILTGYLLGAAVDLLLGGGIALQMDTLAGEAFADTEVDGLNQMAQDPVFVELGVIGYIIPGLIALWFNRQGVMQTLAALIVTSVLVRLVLIIIVPDVLIAYDSGNVSFSEFIAELLVGGD